MDYLRWKTKMKERCTTRTASLVGIFLLFLFALSIGLHSSGYGLQFDSVYRLNNLISIFNPNAEHYDQSIYSISLFGHSIPIMYKEYITSTHVFFRYLPVVWFSNYYFGFRIVNLFFLIISILGSYTILSRFKGNLYAFVFCCIVMLCPINYPMVYFFNFVNWDHILFFFIYFACLHYFAEREGKRIYLAAGMFVLGLSINCSIFNAWIALTFLLTLVIFYPSKVIKIIKDWRNVLIAVVSCGIGMINYVIYNVANNFVTVRIFLDNIFNHDEAQTIDYMERRPLLEEITLRIGDFITRWGALNLLMLAILIIVCLTMVIRFRKVIWTKRLLFAELFATVFCLFFILITPNAMREEHFVRLLPFLVFLVMDLFLTAQKAIAQKKNQFCCVLPLFALVILLQTVVYNWNTTLKSDIRKGTGVFSPAIYNLFDQLNTEYSPDEKVICMEWGFMSQIYFLSKGTIAPDDSHSYQFYNVTDDQQIRRGILQSLIRIGTPSETVYFPIYINDNAIAIYEGNPYDSDNFSSPGDLLVYYLDHFSANYVITPYYEKTGEPVMAICRVDNYSNFYANFLLQFPEEWQKDSDGYLYQLGESFDLSANSHLTMNIDSFWTTDTTSFISIPLDSVQDDLLLFLHLDPFVVEDFLPAQELSIYANGTMVGTYYLTKSEDLSILIPRELVSDNYLNLMLEVPTSASPYSFGLGMDVRDLGVAIYDLRIEKLEGRVPKIALEMGRSLIKSKNVESNEDYTQFSANSNLVLSDRVGNPAARLMIKMELKVDEYIGPSTNFISKKGDGWPNDVTFSFGANEENIYIILSDDGTNLDGAWLPLDTLPLGEWKTVMIEFDNRFVRLSVDDDVVIERECGFGELYGSDIPIEIGGGYRGQVRSLEIVIE